MATTDKPVLKDLVYALRTKVANLANSIRAHIKSSGAEHVLATESNPGFMSPELYDKLLGYQKQIDDLRAAIRADDIPAGSMFWYNNTPDTVPEGYVLCDGNNNTLSFADRYVKGTNKQSEIGDIGGTNLIKELPMPRHRHEFKNYVDVETSSELSSYTLPSNSKVKMIISNNKLGWECGGSVNSYPCCYDDYTQYAGTGTKEGLNIKLQPPYTALHVIKRQDTIRPVVHDGVGTLSIYIGSKLPIGVYECNGQTLSTMLYQDILRYARNNNLLRTAAEYTAALNEFGASPYFVYNEANATIKLPTIRNMIRIAADGSVGVHEITEAPHFHGMGDMPDNQGTWGRLSYTTTYPSGTKGYFWNGRGGHSVLSAPVLDGSVIVSNNISLGDTGNGLVTHSTNVVVGIRVYHVITDAVSTTMVDDINAIAAAAEDDFVSAITDLSLLSTPGWHKDPEGLTSAWGKLAYGRNTTINTTLPLTFSEPPYFVEVQYEGEERATVEVVSITESKLTIKLLGEPKVGDEIYYKVYGRVSA